MVKTTRSLFACAFLCLLSFEYEAFAQYEHYQPENPRVFDEIVKRQTTLSLKQGTTDDTLMALAQAGDIDFIADATGFSPQPHAIPNDPKGSLLKHIIEVANERKLTWLRFSKSTFLFWSEPDIAAIAARIARGEEISLLTPIVDEQAIQELQEKWKQAGRKKLSREFSLRFVDQQLDYKFGQHLAAALREAYGWNFDETRLEKEIRLQDLAPDLRAKVLGRTQQKLLRGTLPIAAEWFDDKFWQDVQIRLVRSHPQDSRLRLFVQGQTGGKTSLVEYDYFHFHNAQSNP